MLKSNHDVREVVREEVISVLRARGTAAAAVTGDEPLQALGLDSLALAQLVLALEERLGVEPFESLVAITDVRTVADLAAAYELARGASAGGRELTLAGDSQ